MNDLNDRSDIYTLKPFSIWGATIIFSVFWIILFIFLNACGQTSLYIKLLETILLVALCFFIIMSMIIIFIYVIIHLMNSKATIDICISSEKLRFDWNTISISFLIGEEFFSIKNGLFDSSLFKDPESIIAGLLITVLIAVQGFIVLQLGMSVCTRFKNQLFLYKRHAFKTIDTLLSNLSMGTFLVSIIFSLYGDIDMGDEVKAIVATIISINVCMFINKICFSLFYSPENRHAIAVHEDYHFFSLFENDDILS